MAGQAGTPQSVAVPAPGNDATTQLPLNGAWPEVPGKHSTHHAAASAAPQADATYLVLFDKEGSVEGHRRAIAAVDPAAATTYSGISRTIGRLKIKGATPAHLAVIKRLPGVAAVAADAHAITMATPNDPYYQSGSQWWLQPTTSVAGSANVQPAWTKTTGSASTVVAVVDTGSVPHPDMAGRWAAGYDFVSGDTDPTDPGVSPGEIDSSQWHGTRVASMIAAATNNNVGLAGATWAGKVQPVRVMTGTGGYESDIIKGILWSAGLHVEGAPANATPAKIINLSLGMPDTMCDMAMQSAIDSATAAGAIVVAAAGNDGVDAGRTSPARCNNVLAVGSHNEEAVSTSFSNYGETVDVSAPGSSIFGAACNESASCLTYGYALGGGTSFSAAIVSGIGALAVDLAPNLTTARLTEVLQQSGKTLYCLNGNLGPCGNVAVDADAALAKIASQLRFTGDTAGVTLPLSDGFRDRAHVETLTPSANPVTLELRDIGGFLIHTVGTAVPQAAAVGYKAAFDVGSGAELTGLAFGTYYLVASQDDPGGAVTTTIPFLLGSGRAGILLFADDDTIYPYPDGYLDYTTLRVFGSDETGTQVPLTGSITFAGKVTTFTSQVLPTLRVDRSAPFGSNFALASASGPLGTASVSTAGVTVNHTGADVPYLSLDTSTVYPVRDGYLDSVGIRFVAPSNTGIEAPATGTIRVKLGKRVVRTWQLSSTGDVQVGWNGKVRNRLVPGRYLVSATITSGDVGTKVAYARLTVSKKKQVWRTLRSPWYSAASAFDFCDGVGYYACEYYNTTGARYYSAGDPDGGIAAQSSLPFPIATNRVGSWRLWTSGWSTDAAFATIMCENADINTCNVYDPGSQLYSGPTYVDRYWITAWTSAGVANGRATWRTMSVDWGSFYAYGYRVEVRYWTLK